MKKVIRVTKSLRNLLKELILEDKSEICILGRII